MRFFPRFYRRFTFIVLTIAVFSSVCGSNEVSAASDEPSPATAAAITATPGLRAVGGSHDISRIRLIGIYYLPPGRKAIPDWQERISYYLSRAAKFHARELTGQSRIEWEVRPTPFNSPILHLERPKDANDWFWRIAGEVKETGWTRKPQDTAFPILLVFTDTNYCPGYDEWKRNCDPSLCICPDHPKHCAGHVTRTGEERPGSSCGGSRAVYWKGENMGFGVVSGDGWRVPMKGADCVAYHEGVGHAIGLPHPEPIDNSVMGTAQYEFSLNQTTLAYKQKEMLGWRPAPIDRKSGLFSTLEASCQPTAPRVGQKATITATVPASVKTSDVRAEYQTAFGDWTPLSKAKRQSGPAIVQKDTLTWTLPAFAQPVFVSYRIIVKGENDEREEWWDLVRIRK